MTKHYKYTQIIIIKLNGKTVIVEDFKNMKIFHLFMTHNLDPIKCAKILHNSYLNMKYIV